MNINCTLWVFATSLRQRVEVAKPREEKKSKSSGFQLALTVAKNNVDPQVVVSIIYVATRRFAAKPLVAKPNAIFTYKK